MKDAAIAVLGGGPTGLAAALLLAQRGFSVDVFDARAVAEAERDPRLLALSRGSWQMLEAYLSNDAPPRAPISRVHVSSSGEFGVTRIDSGAAAQPLGATVRYGELLRALAAAAQRAGIRQHRPVQVRDIVTRPQDVQIVCADAPDCRAVLAVHAEGTVAGSAAADTPQALLAEVTVEGLAPGIAIERFTRSGPLALLPLPGAPGNARALVWCSAATLARSRSALDDAAFGAALQAELGTRIGRVARCGPRRTFALTHALRDEVRAHRSVWLGNAAQTLHPVAGQGLNLGLRDCATLADCLATHEDVAAALAAYARRRSGDRRAIAALTRALPAVFATRFAPLALARSFGLTALDLAPPLRDALAHLLIFGVRA